VPRHEFVPPEQRGNAYDNRPLPIGYGQTISQPYIVALMTDLVNAGGTTLVMVTHSRHVAGFLARQVCLEHGRLLDGS